MNKSVYILIALFTLCISSCSDENDILRQFFRTQDERNVARM